MLLAVATSNMYSSDIPGDGVQVLGLVKGTTAIAPKCLGKDHDRTGLWRSWVYDDAIATLEHGQELASLGCAHMMSRKNRAYGVSLVKDAIRRDPQFPNFYGDYFWQAMSDAARGTMRRPSTQFGI
jgi:hypothetical protein